MDNDLLMQIQPNARAWNLDDKDIKKQRFILLW